MPLPIQRYGCAPPFQYAKIRDIENPTTEFPNGDAWSLRNYFTRPGDNDLGIQTLRLS
jgi:hypothetical protein